MVLLFLTSFVKANSSEEREKRSTLCVSHFGFRSETTARSGPWTGKIEGDWGGRNALFLHDGHGDLDDTGRCALGRGVRSGGGFDIPRGLEVLSWAGVCAPIPISARTGDWEGFQSGIQIGFKNELTLWGASNISEVA